jgi:hypothetical protein
VDLSDIIRIKRETLFSSPKVFAEKYSDSLEMRYHHYTKIENGERIPNPDHLENICRILDIDRRQAAIAWAKASLTDDFASCFDNQFPVLSKEDLPAGNTLLLNPIQCELLKEDPVYWEIINFLLNNSLAKTVAKEFSLSVKNATLLLIKMIKYGLISKNDDDTYQAHDWIFIPETEIELRRKNFQRAVKQLEKNDEPYRITNTQKLTKRQFDKVNTKIANAVSVALDEIKPSIDDEKESDFYTIALIAGRRNFGN